MVEQNQKFWGPLGYYYKKLEIQQGDAGEFILALQIYEQITQRQLNQEAVDSIFTTFLTLMKQAKFYMCTDDEAIDHLEKELGVTFSIQSLKHPLSQMKIDLMNSLLKPENNGCYHIKSMLKSPENYGVRPDIIRMFLKSYYKVLWDESNPLHDKLILDGLAGRHEEKAFLEIRSNEACSKKLLAPLIHTKRKISLSAEQPSEKEKTYHEPSSAEKQFSAFVNHIDAVSEKRKFMAKFFSEHINHNGERIDIEQMHHRMNKHGLTFLELTGSKIAKYLPFYTLSLM